MAFVTGYDPQAGNKQLMKNIGKLVTTTFEIGSAIAGAYVGGPMGGAIGSQVGRGVGSAITGQDSAISGDVGASIGYMAGEKFEAKPKPTDSDYDRVKGSFSRKRAEGPLASKQIKRPGETNYMAMYGNILNPR